ncbi:MAG TPA: ABC transporter ATP-binding protein [Ktedonobacteraceae bacterium]|nr:ABC transporter ATP-binding protein [Ktedonobacteraceae bacterium]
MADSNSNAMIKVQHVYKRYGSVHALEDLSLEVLQGAVYGLIGPNGAGKTTLLRILSALISPTSGQVWLDNEEVTQSPTAIRRKVGYMPDFFGVYPDLTSAEYLEFYAGISGVARRNLASSIKDLLELVNLSEKRDAPVETLSRGMKQRLCLARALIHDPRILLLDEPASGLDPGARVEFRELLRTLQGMGKTIVVSSHILLDLAEMCSHIAIIRAGKLVIEGDVEHVIRALGGAQRIEVRVLERAEEAIQTLKDMPEISSVSLERDDENGQVIHAEFTGNDLALHHILAALLAKNVLVVSFAPLKAVERLEEVYMNIMEGVPSL